MTPTTDKKHIHFIGICGVAMSALAIALKEQGHTITGSDKGFYPPVSDNLKKSGISFYPGWHPEKMTAQGAPDLVVVGNVAGSQNPEWRYVQEHNLTYKSYPEVVKEFIIKKNSIVCAGTFGKSTNATLMSFILKDAGYDPSYMFGGVSVNTMPPAHISKTDWSVVEGDEYKTARWDDGAKFFHYAPTHLLLTAAVWDHADVYPTESSYREAFQKLIAGLPKNGVFVTHKDEPSVQSLIADSPVRPITYGEHPDADYQYTHVAPGKNGTLFDIRHAAFPAPVRIDTHILGDYTAKNVTACFAMCREIGISPETIIAAIRAFKGVKRRLEKRFEGAVTVFDDIAHSPEKARAVLASLRRVYNGDIYAVFEPNTGHRKPTTKPLYADAFDAATFVIIPRLSLIKTEANDPEPPMNGKELADVIGQTHPNVRHISHDETLIDHLARHMKKDDIVVFLGSHGFRGMIDALIKQLS